jgi:hypothetical protein
MARSKSFIKLTALSSIAVDRLKFIFYFFKYFLFLKKLIFFYCFVLLILKIILQKMKILF